MLKLIEVKGLHTFYTSSISNAEININKFNLEDSKAKENMRIVISQFLEESKVDPMLNIRFKDKYVNTDSSSLDRVFEYFVITILPITLGLNKELNGKLNSLLNPLDIYKDTQEKAKQEQIEKGILKIVKRNKKKSRKRHVVFDLAPENNEEISITEKTYLRNFEWSKTQIMMTVMNESSKYNSTKVDIETLKIEKRKITVLELINEVKEHINKCGSRNIPELKV